MRSLPTVAGKAHLARQQLLARALYAQGMVGSTATGLPELRPTIQEAIVLAHQVGDKRTLGYSLGTYFIASLFSGLPDGPAAAEEGFALLNEINRFGMGFDERMRGNYAQAKQYV